MKIDLNCDMGEADSVNVLPADDELMQYISSANIACGYHSGSDEVMRYTVLSALKHGVAIGAHPGLPDRENFGRLEMDVTPGEVYRIVQQQLQILNAHVQAAGAKLHHVKPHGALYNMAARDAGLARAIAYAVCDLDPSLILYALSGSEMIYAAEKLGLRTASEVFADRTYRADGLLTPRSEVNALISDAAESIEQVMMMINQQTVIATNGTNVPLRCDTICLHSDGKHAVDMARLIHGRLIADGITIAAL